MIQGNISFKVYKLPFWKFQINRCLLWHDYAYDGPTMYVFHSSVPLFLHYIRIFIGHFLYCWRLIMILHNLHI